MRRARNKTTDRNHRLPCKHKAKLKSRRIVALTAQVANKLRITSFSWIAIRPADQRGKMRGLRGFTLAAGACQLLWFARYVVYVGSSSYASTVLHLEFVVQSSEMSPQYLDQRVEAFLQGFRQVRREEEGVNENVTVVLESKYINDESGTCY